MGIVDQLVAELQQSRKDLQRSQRRLFVAVHGLYETIENTKHPGSYGHILFVLEHPQNSEIRVVIHFNLNYNDRMCYVDYETRGFERVTESLPDWVTPQLMERYLSGVITKVQVDVTGALVQTNSIYKALKGALK